MAMLIPYLWCFQRMWGFVSVEHSYIDDSQAARWIRLQSGELILVWPQDR